MVTLLEHTRTLRPALLARLFVDLLAALLIVGYLGEDVLEQVRFAFETPLLISLHARSTPALDHLALLLTTLGGVGVIAPLSALILGLLWWTFRPLALCWGLSVAGAAALNLVMKLIFHRARPEVWPRLVYEGHPSGHGMSSMALVVSTVGMGRLDLGVHSPPDILAGWRSGLAWVLGVYSLRRRTLAQAHL